MFKVNEEWFLKFKIVKFILLFVIRSSGHIAKKKQDKSNKPKEESKDPKDDEAMDFQPNIIHYEKPEK